MNPARTWEVLLQKLLTHLLGHYLLGHHLLGHHLLGHLLGHHLIHPNDDPDIWRTSASLSLYVVWRYVFVEAYHYVVGRRSLREHQVNQVADWQSGFWYDR